MFDNHYLFIMAIVFAVATILASMISLIFYRGRGRFFVCFVDHVFIVASLVALFLIIHPWYIPNIIGLFR